MITYAFASVFVIEPGMMSIYFEHIHSNHIITHVLLTSVCNSRLAIYHVNIGIQSSMTRVATQGPHTLYLKGRRHNGLRQTLGPCYHSMDEYWTQSRSPISDPYLSRLGTHPVTMYCQICRLDTELIVSTQKGLHRIIIKVQCENHTMGTSLCEKQFGIHNFVQARSSFLMKNTSHH